MEKNNTPREPIDLQLILNTVDYLDDQVCAAERLLRQRHVRRETFLREEYQKILNSTRAGATTGSRFQDNLVIYSGLDRGSIQKMKAFDARLRSSAGLELLIKFSHEKRVKSRTAESESEYRQTELYYLGMLSGKGLAMKCDDGNTTLTIYFPFKAWVRWEISGKTLIDMSSRIGPMRLESHPACPGAHSLYRKITDDDADPTTKIMVGQEINLYQEPEISKARAMLHAALPQEITFLGDSI